MKTFYHNSDTDGVCSAAILYQKYPQMELHGINYGDGFPWDSIAPNETVYMVDFSLQPFSDMIKLNKLADLIWIDHHKSAIEEMEKSNIKFEGIQKVGLGACALVWEWCHSIEWSDMLGEMPQAVKLLAEYDVWNHSHSDTLPFQYGINTLNCASNPADLAWEDLLLPELGSKLLSHLISQGRGILKYIIKDNTRKASTLCFDHEIDGLKVLAANFGPSNSKLFDSVWDPKVYDAMMLFYFKGNHWTVSLYSDREDIDVSKICKARDGGGHKGAAGFQVESLKEIGLGGFDDK